MSFWDNLFGSRSKLIACQKEAEILAKALTETEGQLRGCEETLRAFQGIIGQLEEDRDQVSHLLHQTKEALYLAQGLDSPEARRRQDIFDKYRFTPRAQLACRLYTLHFNSDKLGASHHEMKVFFPDDPSDEGLIHELSHVYYWTALRHMDGVKTEEFIGTVWEEAANALEDTPLWKFRFVKPKTPGDITEFGKEWYNLFWHRSKKKAWEPWKGPGFSWSPFTAVVNDEELFAGLASYCLADLTKLPESLRPFYRGLFTEDVK